jgi:hypothetical protein
VAQKYYQDRTSWSFPSLASPFFSRSYLEFNPFNLHASRDCIRWRKESGQILHILLILRRISLWGLKSPVKPEWQAIKLFSQQKNRFFRSESTLARTVNFDGKSSNLLIVVVGFSW